MIDLRVPSLHDATLGWIVLKNGHSATPGRCVLAMTTRTGVDEPPRLHAPFRAARALTAVAVTDAAVGLDLSALCSFCHAKYMASGSACSSALMETSVHPRAGPDARTRVRCREAPPVAAAAAGRAGGAGAAASVRSHRPRAAARDS